MGVGADVQRRVDRRGSIATPAIDRSRIDRAVVDEGYAPAGARKKKGQAQGDGESSHDLSNVPRPLSRYN